MDIFITGATGYIGSAVTSELSRAGHRVVALNRASEKEGDVAASGAEPHPGDLLDPGSYADAARAADAVVHAAFDYEAGPRADRVALEALLAATAGREARLIYTSGCWVVGGTGGRVWGDDAPTDEPADLVAWRVPYEKKVIEAAGEGRCAAVVRPGAMYGRAGAFTARLFKTAERDGAAEHVGDGSNHWSMIHIDDLARLYRIVIEKKASGIVQAVDDAPLRVADMAVAASRAAGAGGATRSLPLEAAREKLGRLADAMCLDQTLCAPAARALGWEPRHASFVDAAPEAYAEWQRATG